MLEIFFVVLAVAGAMVASVTDLRSGIVPNKLTFSLIAIGLIGNTTYALYARDPSLAVDLISGVFFIFILGYIFWYLGGWSAGDAKEFIFLASLLPRYPSALQDFTVPRLAIYPFPVTLLVNTFLLVFPALVVYSMVVSYRILSLAEFMKPLKNVKSYSKEAILVVSALSLGILMARPYLVAVALLAFHIPRIKETHRYLIALLVILAFVVSGQAPVKVINIFRYFVATVIFFVIIGIFWNSINIFRTKALTKISRISDLDEGDVIAEEIYIQDGKIIRDSRTTTEKFRALVLSESERVARKNRAIIAFPRAAGLSKEEISSLNNQVMEGRLEDTIMVKKSMPFAPVILLGLLTALLIGDLVVLLR